MCLTNFIEFKQIKKSDAIIGYRNWVLNIKEENALLKSTNQDFIWSKQIVKADKLIEHDSGLYSYNYNYNYDNNYNYNYYNNNNYNYYYHISGIIHQYGKVAIHEEGYRSKFAKIDTLLTIRDSDTKGPKEFLYWIIIFNKRIEKLAKHYKCKTIHYQDFVESNSTKRV